MQTSFFGGGFFGSEFFNVAADVIDTHDGDDEHRKREAKRDRERVEASRRLRQMLADLIDGPRIADEPVITLPQPEVASDEEVAQWRELVQMRREEARQRLIAQAIEDDDEEILMLAGI